MRLVKRFDPNHISCSALERRQYRSGHRPLVIAISEMVRDHFREHYQLPAEDLRLVRLATDADRLDECDRPKRRHEWRQAWDVEPDKTVALFAAINYRLKGLDPLLHAVRLMADRRNFRLLVAGNADTAAYRRMAHRLGIGDCVRFVGYVPDMRNGYFASDFFVHPTFYDPCSHVVLEAMTCGLPVITSRYNGASELMRPPREGLVVDDPHDHERLAWCLSQFLDPARRAACSQAARRTAAQWTFEQHYRQMLAVFAEAASRKQAA